jgi:hypothetical protein
MIASSNDAITVLRIELEYIEPLIWRRIAVRTSMNLKTLHKVIQAAMGWLDYHLWECVASIAGPFQMSAAKLQMVWQRLASCSARRLASPRRRGPNVARTIRGEPARRDPSEIPFLKNCGESRIWKRQQD